MELTPSRPDFGLLDDVLHIIYGAREVAYLSINAAMVHRNWLLGKRIAQEDLRGENRAEYGAAVICKLARELRAR